MVQDPSCPLLAPHTPLPPSLKDAALFMNPWVISRPQPLGPTLPGAADALQTALRPPGAQARGEPRAPWSTRACHPWSPLSLSPARGRRQSWSCPGRRRSQRQHRWGTGKCAGGRGRELTPPTVSDPGHQSLRGAHSPDGITLMKEAGGRESAGMTPTPS